MKNSKIYVGIGIALVLGVIMWQSGFFEQADEFIKVRLYDENGNLLRAGSSLSIVSGIPGVSFIDLTVTATNTGEIPLTCNIVSATPSAFDTAINKDARIVPADAPKKASWTSDLISVGQFEPLGQPVRFQAIVRCQYKRGVETITLDDKIGYIDLTILPDVENVGFEVNVDTGGTGTEYCGDGICQINEDALSCPDDCAVAPLVNFRTTDLGYVSGSAIAYSSTCGNVLTAYGRVTSLDTGYNRCNLDINLGSLALSNLPLADGIYSEAYLYNDKTDMGTKWVCLNEADGSGSVKRMYTTADSDASKIDTTATSFDPDKEVIC